MNNTNPFANVFTQSNPFLNMGLNMGNMGGMNAMNPMTMWQNWAKQVGTMCMPVQQKATTEPFAFSPLMQGNPIAMFQQSMEFWQQFFAPAKAASAETPAGVWPFMGAAGNTAMNPKVTVMTIELGDMAPYIKQAGEFMQQWQNMWLQNVGGAR